MEGLTHDDKIFEDISYTGQAIKGREFQSCIFKRCDFTDSDLSGNKFLDCTFEHCNLSMTKLGHSTLNNAQFKYCKILGVNFYECQDLLFGVGFECCIMDYSSFMRKKMLKTRFFRSSLKEVNFSGTNLGGSIFDQADLSGTLFNGADLSSANFVSAFNYSIDPELNNVRNAVFSAQGLSGLLDKYGIKVV